MLTTTPAPSFTTQEADILNTSQGVSVSLPVSNSGTAQADSLIITGVTLSTAVRTLPQAMPVFVGDVGIDNSIIVSAVFNASNLQVGNPYLMSVRGTYQQNSITYAFQVNRFVVIPALVASPVQYLSAAVSVQINESVWSYSLSNNEPGTSSNFISAFSLDIAAAVSVVGTPTGWGVITDNLSYVLWYAIGDQPPYANQLAPGHSLSGFAIQSATSSSASMGYTVTAWNHASNLAGSLVMGAVLSPSGNV
jgi:hypothetical protein